MDQLAQEGLAKLRNNPLDVRLVGETICPLEDRSDEPVANLRHPPSAVYHSWMPAKSLSVDSANLTWATVMP